MIRRQQQPDFAIDIRQPVEREILHRLERAGAGRRVQRGFEIHLLGTIPVAPLDPSLVMTDKQSKAWLEGQLKGIPRKGGK